jgi:hypothetical protein
MCVLYMEKKTLKVLICKIFETNMFIIMCSHSLSQIEVVVGWSRSWFSIVKMKVQFSLLTTYNSLILLNVIT